MTETRTDIGKATDVDLDDILELQAANQTDRGGTLSASLPRSRVAAMMQTMPLIVARRDGHVTGFLMTTTRAMNADLPIVQAMFAAYHGTADAYVYGPSASVRKSVAKGWRRPCSWNCGVWNRDAKEFSSYGATTRHHSGRTRGWICARLLDSSLTGLISPFSLTAGNVEKHEVCLHTLLHQHRTQTLTGIRMQ